MKIIYLFPSLVAAAAIFSGGCQKNEQSPTPKKGSSPDPALKPAESTTGSSAEKKEPAETKIDHASAVEAVELMKKDPAIVILDIRTPDEYATGHIPESINIDFKADNFEDELNTLDKNRTYLVHCRSGGRSSSSLKIFSKLGFKHIIHLDGGMMDWGKEQFPVEK